MYFSKDEITKIITEEYIPDSNETEFQSKMNIDLILFIICNDMPNNKWLNKSIDSKHVFNVLEIVRPVIENDWVNNVYNRIKIEV